MTDESRPSYHFKVLFVSEAEQGEGWTLEGEIKARNLLEVRNKVASYLPPGSVIREILVDGVRFGERLEKPEKEKSPGRPRGITNKGNPPKIWMGLNLQTSVAQIFRYRIPRQQRGAFASRVLEEALNKLP